MRVRHIALVARDLEPVVDDLQAVLGIEVSFRDPQIRQFGMHDAVLPIGDTFVEVASPLDPKASAERYLARRGDGGYMVCVQCDDIAADRRRLEELGVRTVLQVDEPEIRTNHLHPRDTGGVLLSFEHPSPVDAWKWGGPEWRRHVRREIVDAIVGAEIQSEDPRALARRWSEILGRPAQEIEPSRFTIALDGSEIRFGAATDGRGEGLAGFDVRATDPAELFHRAGRRGLEIAGDRVAIGGVWIRAPRAA